MEVGRKLTMSDTIIYCYSSTGNCLDMAKNIAKGLGGADIIMMRSSPISTDARMAKRVGFLFPCCGGGLPGDVENIVRQIQIAPDTYKFAVCQFSGYMGVGLHKIDQIVGLDYWRAVSHQCAYIPLLPHTVMLPFMSPEAAQKRSEKVAGEIAADVRQMKRSGRCPPRRTLNALERETVWPLIAKRNMRKFKATDRCIGCGLCEKLCPTKNIRLVNGRPTWGADCYQCVSCLQYCPKHAISLGRVTDRREHYHNPNIQATDLMQDIIHIN